MNCICRDAFLVPSVPMIAKVGLAQYSVSRRWDQNCWHGTSKQFGDTGWYVHFFLHQFFSNHVTDYSRSSTKIDTWPLGFFSAATVCASFQMLSLLLKHLSRYAAGFFNKCAGHAPFISRLLPSHLYTSHSPHSSSLQHWDDRSRLSCCLQSSFRTSSSVKIRSYLSTSMIMSSGCFLLLYIWRSGTQFIPLGKSGVGRFPQVYFTMFRCPLFKYGAWLLYLLMAGVPRCVAAKR